MESIINILKREIELAQIFIDLNKETPSNEDYQYYLGRYTLGTAILEELVKVHAINIQMAGLIEKLMTREFGE
jgi:hypothetical protein